MRHSSDASPNFFFRIRYTLQTVLTLAFLLELLIPSVMRGQDEHDIRSWAEEIADTYAGENETEDLSLLVEDLTGLARNPLNINIAEREDLERIFFLSDIQIENILYRRYVSGPFHSVYELQTVEGLSVSVIRLLKPVIYFGETDDKDGSLKIWGDWFLRSEKQLEEVRGFQPDDTGTTPFVGDPYKLYSRTSLHTNKGLNAGFIAEKDPGEPMFGRGTQGLDLMTGYIHYENRNHWVREVAAGQYRMSAGQGLVLQSGMPVRKSSLTTSIRNRRSSFRPSLSASESSGFRGGYVTLGTRRLEISPFFSVKRRDGRITGDSLLISLRENGLHRTRGERAQQNTGKEKVMGVRTRYGGRIFSLEAGHVQYHINPPLYPEERVYNRFDFRGEEMANSWMSYLLSINSLLAFGEVAFTNEFSSPAFWNGLVWNVAPGFSLALGHRYIPVSYQAPLAGPLTESGRFAGEKGLYAGIKWEMASGFVISSYLDRYQFDWLKYRLDAPGKGFDFLSQVEKEFQEDTRLRLRYRHREKPVNIEVDPAEAGVGQNIYDQLKVQYRQSISQWQLTSLAQWQFVQTREGNENGYMLAQDLKWRSQNEKLTLTTRYALFSTSDYLARLYAYEPHVLYMFSVPAYSGRGSRYLFLCNYKWRNNLHLWLRAARWHYSDRETTGSGYREVAGDKKTVFTVQARIKF